MLINTNIKKEISFQEKVWRKDFELSKQLQEEFFSGGVEAYVAYKKAERMGLITYEDR